MVSHQHRGELYTVRKRFLRIRVRLGRERDQHSAQPFKSVGSRTTVKVLSASTAFNEYSENEFPSKFVKPFISASVRVYE